MIELTDAQRRAIAVSSESPPIMIDRQANAIYVLVLKEAYDRLKGVPEDDDARLMAPLLSELDSEDWEDAGVYEDKP